MCVMKAKLVKYVKFFVLDTKSIKLYLQHLFSGR